MALGPARWVGPGRTRETCSLARHWRFDPATAPRAGDVAFWEKHNPAALAVARGSEGPSRAPAGAGAVAYVCERFTCREPTSDPVRLRELLEGGMGGPGEVRAFDVGMLRRGAGKRE